MILTIKIETSTHFSERIVIITIKKYYVFSMYLFSTQTKQYL